MKKFALGFVVLVLAAVMGILVGCGAEPAVMECPDCVVDCPAPEVVVEAPDLSQYDVTGMGRQSVGYYERMDLNLSSSQYPALHIDQQGTGHMAQFDASGTTVFKVEDSGKTYIEDDFVFENDETISNDTDGVLTVTLPAAGDLFVSTGNVRVGDGTPGTAAMDGEDLYVEGASEFDGAMEVDGALNVDGAADFDSTMDVAGNFSVNSTNLVVTAASGNTDVAGTLQYGANDLYPMGYGSSGYQMVMGKTSVNVTSTLSHGLTTPTYGLCTLSGTLTDNEEQKCSVGISGSTVTAYVYKEDGTAGDSAVDVFWMVVGTP